MNSTKSWSEDYHSSWTLRQSLPCLHIGKILSYQMNLFVWSDLLLLGRASIDRTRAGRYANIIHRKVRL